MYYLGISWNNGFHTLWPCHEPNTLYNILYLKKLHKILHGHIEKVKLLKTSVLYKYRNLISYIKQDHSIHLNEGAESLKLAHFHLKQSNSILWEIKCVKIDGWVGTCMSEWVSEWISERCRAARNEVRWNLYFNEHQNNKISAWHFPFFTQQCKPLMDLVLFITEASLSHSDTPHSIGLLWMSDQPDTQTSTWQPTTLTRDRHLLPRWDTNQQSQLARDRRSES
jgi:hypothetical protein